MEDFGRLENKVDNILEDMLQLKVQVTGVRDFMLQNMEVKKEQKELEKRVRRLEQLGASILAVGSLAIAIFQILT